MFDEFLTSADDLPPIRLRRARSADPDATTDMEPSSSAGASRTVLVAGVLIAAAIVGTPAPKEDTSSSDAPAPASRTS